MSDEKTQAQDRINIKQGAFNRTEHTDTEIKIIDSPDKTKIHLRAFDRNSTEKSRELSIGDVVKNRFVLDRLLGTGGMGAVFRALDLRKKEAADNRPYVALKILGADFKDHPNALVTLQREARKTQDLAHPNIVTVYDFDRDGDLVYLTMEELQGNSLADLLLAPSTAFDFDEKISILRQIAEGLAYAHSKGLVHSDLKPANIFYTKDKQIKILDFGIARAANSNLYDDGFDAGQLGALTTAYASLEMLSNQPPDPSDDIYALGIIACEIFTGKHPYNKKDAQQALNGHLLANLPHTKNPLLNRLFVKSIALHRKNRITDATIFLRQLHIAVSAPKRTLLIVIALCFLLAGNFLFLHQVSPKERDLSELSAIEQTAFHNYIHEAELALSFNDLQGAVFNVDKAFHIHQTDKSLLAIRDKIFAIENDNLKNAKSETEKIFFAEQLKQLKAYPAFSQ